MLHWIPAFAGMTERAAVFVIPDLIQSSQLEALLRRSRLGNPE